MPADLVSELDAAAKTDFISRSAYIREAVSLRLRLENYVEQEVAEKSSYPNIVKSLHFSRLTSRHANQYKHLPYKD